MKLATTTIALATLSPAIHQPVGAFSTWSYKIARAQKPALARTSPLFYGPDSNNKADNKEFPDNVVWQTLAKTEKWIETTLHGSGSYAANPKEEAEGKKSNPYARKEVSYVCETTNEVTEVICRLFARMREVREIGEAHGKNERLKMEEQGKKYKPHTYRQTLVMVLPSVTELESFSIFDGMVQAVNKARRNARDYLTDYSVEKASGSSSDDETSDTAAEWMTAVNMAHLHPGFGASNTAAAAAEGGEVEKNDEDPKITAYREKKMKARRSPYPSIVIEVRATPPMEAPERAQESNDNDKSSSKSEVTKEDLQKLEALFGKSASTKDDVDPEEEFYKAIGKTKGIQMLSFITPLDKVKSWVIGNADNYEPETSTFGHSDTMHVDSAYEFVFGHIAMDFHTFAMNDDLDSHKCSFLVMPNFLSRSATSFEKFSEEVTNIVSVVPGLSDKLKVSTFHKEHIDEDKRSPKPVIVLEWN
eukprot:CAMPEP_0196807284 /NCGR_PEP_ID=MMETSP1362-20130617/7241_1 /TAXON_ID=163516 /ORGANISM="Leptocylindrus danicus, Strain CCMP1856" /LENGTH=474 /DNA_ID=CAMNT_0042181129 /DNA_START=43 /DNA_END=1467 /DNA_ORIENTATION=-